ncbi:enoyl-CoA hydratase-related protein [Desulfitobacterium sp.]|uniref:enoyl-CoA hydratase-related protein n=1 Tax=Desulfitobacterium sp. TaxID=49981 RepID=UPI002B686739|nr:enoyl-CoA hydratase-related protein [Desulfitobacterium sp.]HVJ49920.1 enoyl-CoA hydratase-related protein [Desulfitobacterium sp.]
MTVECVVERGIAKIVIDRPKALNALNAEVLQELQNAVTEIQNRKDVRVAIIQGGGEKCFVAGADIAEMANLDPLEGSEFGRLGQKVFSAVSELPFPTIAVIQGFALGGGCELALACDIRIASGKARFGQPEVGLGIIPGFGGTPRLARLIGPGQAKKLIFSAEMISAAQALGIGLVEQVVAPEQLNEAAMKLAQAIATKSPNAVHFAKIAINQGLEGSLEEGMRLEAGIFGLCFASPEQKVGMTAFLEKRTVEF